MTRARARLLAAALLAAAPLAAGCGDDGPGADPIDRFLPSLPPEGGPALAAAGRITQATRGELVSGPASQGLVGDYFLRNDRIRVVVQQPGRWVGPCPYGGAILDVDRVDAPAGDQLGKVSPFFQLGRTVDARRVEVVRDGARGGPAVLRVRGRDVQNDYINLTGLGGVLSIIREEYRATVDLGLEAAITYVLRPGAAAVEVSYTFYNPAGDEVSTPFGMLVDSGAQIEIFHPGVGFGDASLGDLLTGGAPPLEYTVFQGQGIAYGLVPRPDDPASRGVALSVSGVDAEVYDVATLADVLGPRGQTLRIPARGGVTRRVELVVARDAGGVEQAVRARKGQAAVAFAGIVTTATSHTPVAGARVLVTSTDLGDPAHDAVTVLVSDGSGRLSGALRPGTYALQAEGDGYLRGAPATVTLAPDQGAPATVALAIPEAARLDFRVHDRAGAPLASRVMVVGARAAEPSRRFRDTVKDFLPPGVAAALSTREGDSSRATRWDHPLALLPGRYRLVIGHGPEWSRHESVLDLGPAGATVDATLDRVVDTTGYVAADFHQHTHVSPDSPVPPEDRVVGYLAEGIDFVSTSEHDVHFDYRPILDALDARRELDAVVGVEVSPFTYGHFIGFPVVVDPLSPTGGALDWGVRPMALLDLAPAEIFAGLRARGAEVVEVNHPRAAFGTDVIGTALRNFDRAGLTFDFAAHTFGGSRTLEKVKAAELGLPDGAELFSTGFDTLEVYNGVLSPAAGAPGERADAVTDNALRDWMDFLSFGFLPTAVGNSDSHQWVIAPPGLPRTMVRVPDDSPAALAAGVGGEVVRTLLGRDGAPRDVVVTNTPMMRFTVDGRGVGATVPYGGAGPLALAVRIETPSWAPVDTVEIYANATFVVPPPAGATPTPFQPVLCFTSRGAPTERCAHAVGGARPLAVATVAVAPGASRLEATATASVLPSELLAFQRPGATGADVWLVAKATGDDALFPTIPVGLAEGDVAAVVEAGVGALGGKGVPAFAFTNPIYVDVDGHGWHAPFAP